MDIVFLIYGLAFLVLGIVIVIWPKAGSRFELAGLSLWLAGFALVHGALEWMELWRIIHGDNPALAAARPLTLLVSYVLLFEFGRRMLRAARPGAPRWRRAGAWIHALLLGGIAAGTLAHDASPDSLAIWSRYLYGFPGALLSAAGLQAYIGQRIRSELSEHEFPTVRRNCLLAGAALTAYGILGGLIVPQAPWAPAAWLNQEGFLAAVGVPVQIFRAGCAVLIAFSMVRVLQIFHLEQQQHLAQTLQQTAAALEEAGRLGRHNRLLLDSVAEGIFGLDTEGRTTFINPVALTLLGYPADELIGQFTVSRQMAKFLRFIFIAINLSIGPTIAHLHAEGRLEELRSLGPRTVRFATAVVLPVVVAMLFLPGLFLGVYGEEYLDQSSVFRVMVVTEFVNIVLGSVAIWLMMTGHEKLALRGALAGLAVGIALNLALAPGLGALGTAIALLAGLVVTKLVLWRYIQRHLGINPTLFGRG